MKEEKKNWWFLLNASKYKSGKKKGQYRYMKMHKVDWKGDGVPLYNATHTEEDWKRIGKGMSKLFKKLNEKIHRDKKSNG